MRQRVALRARVLAAPGNAPADEARYFALKELAGSPGPIGCWRLRAVLQAVGIVASEATAGRLLRQLDHEGLTRALGSRGRLLTDKGRRHLAAFEQAQRRRTYHNDLLRAIRAENIEDICDLLTARRAVEAETARLAAQRATAADIRRIEAAVQRHIQEMRSGGARPDHNRAVHHLIAQASRSRILQAVVNVLLQEEYLHEVQTHIQRAADGLWPEDHLLIVEAIKNRQPERAAEAMRAHTDRLLRVVRGYRMGTRRRSGNQVERAGASLPP
jgi:GntR family transcriptional regulator, transcriptional repressor for pyruvate dehydrogenase complex